MLVAERGRPELRGHRRPPRGGRLVRRLRRRADRTGVRWQQGRPLRRLDGAGRASPARRLVAGIHRRRPPGRTRPRRSPGGSPAPCEPGVSAGVRRSWPRGRMGGREARRSTTRRDAGSSPAAASPPRCTQTGVSAMAGSDLTSSRFAAPPLPPLSGEASAGVTPCVALGRQIEDKTWRDGLPDFFWGEGVCLLGMIRFAEAAGESFPPRVSEWLDEHARGDLVLDHVNHLAPGTAAVLDGRPESAGPRGPVAGLAPDLRRRDPRSEWRHRALARWRLGRHRLHGRTVPRSPRGGPR